MTDDDKPRLTPEQKEWKAYVDKRDAERKRVRRQNAWLRSAIAQELREHDGLPEPTRPGRPSLSLDDDLIRATWWELHDAAHDPDSSPAITKADLADAIRRPDGLHGVDGKTLTKYMAESRLDWERRLEWPRPGHRE